MIKFGGFFFCVLSVSIVNTATAQIVFDPLPGECVKVDDYATYFNTCDYLFGFPPGDDWGCNSDQPCQVGGPGGGIAIMSVEGYLSGFLFNQQQNPGEQACLNSSTGIWFANRWYTPHTVVEPAFEDDPDKGPFSQYLEIPCLKIYPCLGCFEDPATGVLACMTDSANPVVFGLEEDFMNQGPCVVPEGGIQ